MTPPIPRIFALIYTDTDGKIRIADSSSYRSRMVDTMRVWKDHDRAGRKYRIVRYEAAKARGRKRR
jgi:hypothetical protein